MQSQGVVQTEGCHDGRADSDIVARNRASSETKHALTRPVKLLAASLLDVGSARTPTIFPGFNAITTKSKPMSAPAACDAASKKLV